MQQKSKKQTMAILRRCHVRITNMEKWKYLHHVQLRGYEEAIEHTVRGKLWTEVEMGLRIKLELALCTSMWSLYPPNHLRKWISTCCYLTIEDT